MGVHGSDDEIHVDCLGSCMQYLCILMVLHDIVVFIKFSIPCTLGLQLFAGTNFSGFRKLKCL